MTEKQKITDKEFVAPEPLPVITETEWAELRDHAFPITIKKREYVIRLADFPAATVLAFLGKGAMRLPNDNTGGLDGSKDVEARAMLVTNYIANLKAGLVGATRGKGSKFTSWDRALKDVLSGFWNKSDKGKIILRGLTGDARVQECKDRFDAMTDAQQAHFNALVEKRLVDIADDAKRAAKRLARDKEATADLDAELLAGLDG